MDNNFQLTR